MNEDHDDKTCATDQRKPKGTDQDFCGREHRGCNHTENDHDRWNGAQENGATRRGGLSSEVRSNDVWQAK